MFKDKIKILKKQHSFRAENTITKLSATEILIDKKKLINFCSNDYLSLSNNKYLKDVYKKSIDKYGLSSTSSHLVSGHTIAHRDLEDALKDYLKQEAVALFSTGYMANLGCFSALREDINFILQDKLNHASIIDANLLLNRVVSRYKHNDLESLKQKLQKQNGFGIIATDTIFSMNGDSADILGINKLIQDSNNSILFQDDAHGFGVYNPQIPTNSIYMATFGKAIGLNGAFVAGKEDFITYLKQKSRPYIYTTALSPALAKTIIKSLDLIKTNELQQQLFSNIKLFKKYIKTNSNTAIQPIIIGDNLKALKLEQKLFDAGVYVKAIRPPTVPKAILRITINAGHTQSQIINLTENLINFSY